MNVLITGAAGFIGRRLTEALQTAHSLRLLDSVDLAEATVFMGGEGRKRMPLTTDWPYVRADILDEDVVLAACEGMDAVIHLAGIPTGLPEQGKAIMMVNAVGTYLALDAARKAGCGRFLCASSINAFGTIHWRLSGRPAPYETMPLTEAFDTVEEDPYSLSKRVNEETCAAFNRAYGLTTAAFRFAGVWRQEMYEEHAGKLAPTTAWADDLYNWVHVEDVASGLKAALECPALPGFGVYTLHGPDLRAAEPTMDLLRKFRPDLASRVTEPLPGRAPLMSIRRAREAFGYDPQHLLM